MDEAVHCRLIFGSMPQLVSHALLQRPPESASGKEYVHGEDREGRPVIYMKPRFENTKDYENQVSAPLRHTAAAPCFPQCSDPPTCGLFTGAIFSIHSGALRQQHGPVQVGR